MDPKVPAAKGGATIESVGHTSQNRFGQNALAKRRGGSNKTEHAIGIKKP